MSVDESEFLHERQEAWEAAVRREHGLSRRDALRLAAAGTLVAAGTSALRPRAGWAQSTTPPPAKPVPGVVKPQPPELLIPRGTNLETQWASLRGAGYHTPVDRFFVRNHTTTPVIDAKTWRLKVFGDALRGAHATADRAVEFSLRDLQRLPRVTVDVAIECAGNGRSFYGSQQGTPAAGTAWTLGAIGVARWRGVRLSDVLERAGLRRGAVDVLPQGLDAEVVTNGVNQGRVRRPLPIDKALDDAIIAFEMNGRDLPPDHGFPARLVVPGWVGIASTKWLGSIEVASTQLFSPWNTTSYRLVGGDYPADSPPLTANPLKSAFELSQGAVVQGGRRHRLTGRSWSGRERPARVDVSTDGGRSYRRARLHGPNRDQAWVQWEVDWTPRAAGPVELLARATDRRGHRQPDASPFNRDGYWFDAVVRHPVTVAA